MKWLAFILVLECSALGGVDWAATRFALAQIESGDRMASIGASGERGAFQILPTVASGRGYSWTNARWILKSRLDRFERQAHREATPAELYVLWHRPALLSQNRPWPAHVCDRAARFENLYCGVAQRQRTSLINWRSLVRVQAPQPSK